MKEIQKIIQWKNATEIMNCFDYLALSTILTKGGYVDIVLECMIPNDYFKVAIMEDLSEPCFDF